MKLEPAEAAALWMEMDDLGVNDPSAQSMMAQDFRQGLERP